VTGFIGLLRKALLSPDELRLRAGWRLLAQLLLMLFIMLFASIPAFVVMAYWPAFGDLALVLANGVPMVLSVVIARRFFDRRSVRSLGLHLDRQAWQDVLLGVGIGLLQTGLVFLLEAAFGWLKVIGFAWQQQSAAAVLQSFLLWLGIFLAVGFYEELFSRGYQLQNLAEGLNTFWAVVLSSLVFGVVHLMNPNASWLSAVGITFSGVFLAYAYLRTRQLWLSIGLHIGWNLFLGPLFGFPVSGLDAYGLVLLKVEGPAVITGGEFGPEAGLVLLPALGLGAWLVWLVTRGRPERRTEPDA
jgi:membrane protease YdiL (CAAX protease family)